MRIRSVITFLFYIAVTIGLISCDEPEPKKEKDFQENLNTFNSTMTKLDSTLDLIDELQQEVDNVEEQRALGKISDDEAIEQLNQINNTLGRKIAKVSNFHPVDGLPSWAKELGLSEPVGMVLDKDYSQITSESNESEGFNSVTLVYRGDYDVAMKQAGIIAGKANIPMSKEYEDAIILSEKYNINSIKGASYLNFELGSDNNPRYNISITVKDDGTLTINATDTHTLLMQLDGE
jgi:hypothetical protein